jgi:septal ring factor EnvC (AmiA/AmiB activator)
MNLMDANDAAYVEKELLMSREELLRIIADYRKREREDAAFRIENQNALTAMAKDYQALKEKLEAVVLERDRLKDDLARIADQNQLKAKEIFGRRTEKLADIIDAPLDTEYEDEAIDEVVELPTKVPGISANSSGLKKSRSPGKKRVGKRDEDLSKLPQRTEFQLDIADLDQQYGQGNWRIAFWHNHRTVETIGNMSIGKM